jgi:hypothetical protein
MVTALGLTVASMAGRSLRGQRFVEGPGPGTRASVNALCAVADMWRSNHSGACPTPLRLKQDKELSEASDIDDPWGEPFQIRCDGGAVTALSFGPDRVEGTADDITSSGGTP